jgi:hypothetical protein
MHSHFARRVPLHFLAIAALLCGCRTKRTTSPAPPAEFLVAAGDSTYWVRSNGEGIRRRGSALMLARYDGDFYEVYTTDDDRSFYDAVFVGQRVYRRDLVSGDSTMVYQDTLVDDVRRKWAATHPGELPLAADEDGSDRPTGTATADVELLDVHGPYLSLAHHNDVDLAGATHVHQTRRRVVDLREGRAASLADVLGPDVARDVLVRAKRLLGAARDSIRLGRDPRAEVARGVAGELTLDPRSFSITDLARAPAVAFVVPVIGEQATDLSLPLAPLRAREPAWWAELRSTLPAERDSSDEKWGAKGYVVRARYAEDGQTASLALADSVGHEWMVGRIQAPVHRILWLDSPPLDSVRRGALERAFDDAVLYDDAVRVASRDRARLARHRAIGIPVVAVKHVRSRVARLAVGRLPAVRSTRPRPRAHRHSTS